VLSFPYKLRFHLARDPRFLSTMLGAYLKSVFAWQRHRGRKAGIDDGQTGAITFVQKFGAALNANVHFHSVTPSGLFVPDATADGEGRLVFVPLPPPTDDDVARLAHRIARRLTKLVTRYLAERDEEYTDPDDEQATLQHALSTALRPPVRPQPTLPLGGFGGPEQPPPEKALCSAVAGFSLHAARTVSEHDREGLERLLRYGLRAPFSQQRLSLLPDGRVRYELPRPWPTPAGVTELVMEPLQFLKRLAALLPAPYQNLTRYHGCFANRSRFRPMLPLPPHAADAQLFGAGSHACIDAQAKLEPQPQPQPGTQTDLDLALEEHDLENGTETAAQNATAHDASGDVPTIRPRRLPWASLLKRSLSVDGLECPKCQTQMLLLALITAPTTVVRILDHLRLPSTPPPIASARLLPNQDDLFQEDENQAALLDEPHHATAQAATARAPP